jgi:hypothetical protein
MPVRTQLYLWGCALALGLLLVTGCTSARPLATPPTVTPAEVAVEPVETKQPVEVTLAPTDAGGPTESPTVEPTARLQPSESPTKAVEKPGEPAKDDIADWGTYTNEEHGYTLKYPPDCTVGPLPAACKQKPPEERVPECLCFLNADDPDRVFLEAFTRGKDGLKGAVFSVTRLALDPPPGVDLIEYMREKFPHFEEIPEEPNMEVGGLPAVGLYTPASPMAYSYAEIYLIKDDKLLLIHMQDVDEQANSELYGPISSALDISGMEALAPAAGQRVVAWLGRVVSLPAGSQFDDYVILEPEGAGEVGLTGAARQHHLCSLLGYAHLPGARLWRLRARRDPPARGQAGTRIRPRLSRGLGGHHRRLAAGVSVR